MMRRVYLIGGAILAVFVIAVGGLYFLGGRSGGGGSFFSRLATGYASITGAIHNEIANRHGEFAFTRLDIDTTKAQAEACLAFSQNLDVSGKTHYEDYIAIDPQTRIVVRPVDQRLCISGLAFNQTYTVTLKVGLPAASGAKLAEAETVPVELRDKPALVRFSGGIILPRDNAEGVPVTTVNVNRLKIKVVRVGDRLLSQIENGVVDETTLYSYDQTQLENNQGAVAWSGTMDVANVKNDSVVTLIPIRQILKNKQPGAYVLIARDAATAKDDTDSEDNTERAAQWVIDSDIGLTTFQGADGLAVFARSYATAKPLANVKLTLVARDNNVLATVTTNSDGRADFDPGLFKATGGDEPVVVMAYGAEDDFSFLDLRRPAFDLTDRGVGGRPSPGPVDAFLYTERGVYRPGETVQSVATLRDKVGASVNAPLTLIATRPDGVEFARTTIAVASLVAGTTTWPLSLKKTAPHGRWQIAAYIDPKGEAVGRVQFDV